MPDYSKGKIYSLRSYETDDIYIGSTTQSLAMRKGAHKADYKKYLNGKNNFVTSFNIIKYDDCYIELIEEYSCENKQQLERKEGEYIRNRDCVNKNIAGRSNKEYREDNKDKKAEYQTEYYQKNKNKIAEYYQKNKEKITEKIAEYYQKNKENISEYQAEYYQKNKEKAAEKNAEYRQKNKNKIAEYYQKNKEKAAEKNAEYRQKNKNKIAEKNAEYRQKNKNKIAEKNTEKITCECGSVVTKVYLSKHTKTKKHEKLMKNLQ